MGILGKILKTTDGGENWISKPSGTTDELFSVYFIDSNIGWVVGGYPYDYWIRNIFLKTTDGGDNWTSQSDGTSYYLTSVYFTDSNSGWAVGGSWDLWGRSSGVIFKIIDGGDNWTSGGYDYFLTSVYFQDSNIGYTVGGDLSSGGIILKTTDAGNNWSSQIIETIYPLTSVYFTDFNIGWAVGFNGILLKTTNGGITFAKEEKYETPTDLFLLKTIRIRSIQTQK